MSKRKLELLPGWEFRIGDEFEKPYMESLREFLREEYKAGRLIHPDKDKIFRALQLVDYNDVRVVILGQDPYHGVKQANGLAFAVDKGTALPPSLQNIFKEVKNNFGGAVNTDSTLLSWAQQGVLLLNTVLTVRENQAFSHRQKGWELFTDRVIQELNQRKDPIVFLLWGSAAIEKSKMLNSQKHIIFKAPHPSPLSAHRGYLGCNHFAKTNASLQSRGHSPIEW